MPEVILRLHQFGNVEDATRVADTIKNRGEVSYVDDSGDTVNVTIGDVTIEND